MDLLKLFNKTVFSVTVLLFFFSCNNYTYNGAMHLGNHPWLKGKKIFIDPGHGGKGSKDLFRVGPMGGTEENINLRVSLILSDMLTRAGAEVRMSRSSDIDIPLDKRVIMVNDYQPDLLISIHHNGSLRTLDDVNYPTVFIWGSRQVRPASYDFARLLMNEFHEIMDRKGKILSDFTVFSETGTRILRKTRYTCPGIIGEAGFYSHVRHSVRLNDIHYNQRESEAYFKAISRYFQWGRPIAEVVFSCPVYRDGPYENLIERADPVITINAFSGNEHPMIDEASFRITLDGIRISVKAVMDGVYRVNFGKVLYPGGHRLRFSFKNLRHQSSMIMSVPFTVSIRPGDYDWLKKRGRRLLRSRRTSVEGLKMLLSAHSIGLTDPAGDQLVRDISRGFSIIGDRHTAQYYKNKLHYFYPDSPYSTKYGRSYRSNSYRYPVEYHGKSVRLISGIEHSEKQHPGNPAFEFFQKIFRRSR